jgi:alkanesulfonate monooxygenase SsuD/methylene tetrahydromethanopterin reductase-like flavin-dependent oxidoreductase (luciferase family)
VKFSLWPSNGRSWEETLELAHWAEQSGLDGFWYADHLMPFRIGGVADPGDAHECWTILTAVGALVPRVRLVSMVSPVTIHHPVVLAKRAVTADHVSGGRAVLGLGAGWQENEHVAYGFDLPAPRQRVDRFAEAIEVVQRLLRSQPGESVRFAGSTFPLAEAPLAPRPVGDRLPVLVGTGSPRMLRLTARWADEWNTWGDPDQVRVRTESFLAACDREGRDPSTLRRSVQALIFLDGGPPGEQPVAGRSLVGTSGALVELLQRYADQGVDEFAIPDFNLGSTHAERMDVLERLRTEVLPHVR